MNFNKNIFAFAICLAIFCPVKATDIIPMKQIIITTEAAGENGEPVKNEVGFNAVVVTLEQAQELINNNQAYRIQALENSMIYNKVFTIGNMAYFVNTQEEATAPSVSRSINVTDFMVDENGQRINAIEEQAIEAIVSEIVDSAIETIATEIENASAPQVVQTAPANQTISQATAVILLQQYANSLVAGNSFGLNGVLYTIEESSN